MQAPALKQQVDHLLQHLLQLMYLADTVLITTQQEMKTAKCADYLCQVKNIHINKEPSIYGNFS